MNVKMNTDRLRAHFEGIYQKITNGRQGKELLRSLGKGALLTVYTYLLASTEGLFETFPFALALLCAIPDRMVFAFTGAVLGAVFGHGFSPSMLVGYTVIFLWRTQIARYFTYERDTVRTEEPIVMRCILSAATALGVTVIPMIGSFTYYALFGAFFMVFACPSLTLVFSGAYLVGRTSPLYSSAGKCLQYFCLVLACTKFSLFGFTPALAVAAFVTILEFTSQGAVESCFLGFFSALAIDLNTAVMMAAFALVGAVVKRINRKLAVGAGLLAGMLYAFGVMGNSALFLVFPDLVCASMLALPIVRMRYDVEPMSEEKPTGAVTRYFDGREEQLRQRQEEQTVQSLHRLSGLFYALAQYRIPDADECRVLLERAKDRRCSVCKGAGYCQGDHQKRRDHAFEGAVQSLQRDGKIDGRFLCEVGCMYSAEIADELTLDYTSLCRKKDSPSASDAYASGFETLSKLMIEQKQYRSRERMPRQELSKILTKEARRIGLSFSSVGVYGLMQKTVFFCDCKSADCRGGAEGLRRLCEQVTGARMSFPRLVKIEGSYALILDSLPMYSLEYVKSAKPKPGQKTCGDTIGIYNDADGNPCLLLCDGMGSGAHAAIASGLGCSLSECLSGAGATPKLITELLNSALCQRSEEDSCSFDLFCFDRYGGTGTFIKNGAAPTLVFREGTVYKLSAKSLPLGIVTSVNSEQIRMQMQENDLVILVSDGIAADFEDTAVLASVVSGHEQWPLSELAQRILDECTKHFDTQKDTRKMDDMSVCVVRIMRPDFQTASL